MSGPKAKPFANSPLTYHYAVSTAVNNTRRSSSFAPPPTLVVGHWYALSCTKCASSVYFEHKSPQESSVLCPNCQNNVPFDGYEDFMKEATRLFGLGKMAEFPTITERPPPAELQLQQLINEEANKKTKKRPVVILLERFTCLYELTQLMERVVCGAPLATFGHAKFVRMCWTAKCLLAPSYSNVLVPFGIIVYLAAMLHIFMFPGREKSEFLWWMMIIGYMCAILGVLFMFICLMTDPGYLMPAGEECEANRPADGIESTTFAGAIVERHWCSTCHILRPLRASHCDSCGLCVEEHDHHCSVIGACIGRRNICYFVASVTFITLITFIGDIFVVNFIFRFASSILDWVVVVLALGLLFPLTLSLPLMGVALWSNAVTNATSREQKKERMVNPYDNGTWANLQHFCCAKQAPRHIIHPSQQLLNAEQEV